MSKWTVAKPISFWAVAIFVAFGLSSDGTGRTQGAAQATGTKARADLKDAKGQPVGRAELTETPHGVLIRIVLEYAQPGTHGLHIHGVGKCDPPTFDSADSHFNPSAAQHGFLNAKGPHAGDLPNVHIPRDGRLEFESLAPGTTLGAGKTSLFDADGSALVLHAAADDYRSDPAGNAGDRLACGVVIK